MLIQVIYNVRGRYTAYVIMCLCVLLTGLVCQTLDIVLSCSQCGFKITEDPRLRERVWNSACID